MDSRFIMGGLLFSLFKLNAGRFLIGNALLRASKNANTGFFAEGGSSSIGGGWWDSWRIVDSLFIFPPLLFDLSLVRKGCNMLLLGIFVFMFDQVPIFIIDDSVDLLLDDDPTLFCLYIGDNVDGIEVSGTEGMELKGLEEADERLGFFSAELVVLAEAAVDDDDIRADFVAFDR